MEKKKTPKRPKKPAALYTQELLVKGVLLSVRFDQSMLNSRKVEDVNRCTRLASEFLTKIYDVYSGYSSQLKAVPKQGDNRWKHMEKCLALAGKPAQVTKNSDFADLLGINKNMISDANLLRDERRASIDGVCHVLLGLGWIKRGNTQSDPDENKASARKDAVREPRNRFISYAKQRSTEKNKEIVRRPCHLATGCRWKRMTRNERRCLRMC